LSTNGFNGVKTVVGLLLSNMSASPYLGWNFTEELPREAGINVKLTSIVNLIIEFVVSLFDNEVIFKTLPSGLLLKHWKLADNLISKWLSET
jgi:hypothetical protein